MYGSAVSLGFDLLGLPSLFTSVVRAGVKTYRAGASSIRIAANPGRMREALASLRNASELFAGGGNIGGITLRPGVPVALRGGDEAVLLAGGIFVGSRRATQSILQLCGQSSCFVAGTPLLTPTGAKPIEQFRVGDAILSRAEGSADGAVVVQNVEQTFVRESPIMSLRVRGQEIRTTAEHPFYVEGKGWLSAREIQIGDRLSSHDGQWVTVEEVTDLNEVATVYNLRVSDYHTYFVGSREWGFSVWAHNANYQTWVENGQRWVRNVETGVISRSTHATEDALLRALRETDPNAVVSQLTGALPTTRAANARFIQAEVLTAEENVRRLNLAGTLPEARAAAARSEEVLPGLFMYGGHADIPGYQLHHIWPQALGGPLEGWGVYARGPLVGTTHTATGGVQQSLDLYLRRVLNPSGQGLMPLDAMRTFARANPEQVLPHLREFYRTTYPGIVFPY